MKCLAYGELAANPASAEPLAHRSHSGDGLIRIQDRDGLPKLLRQNPRVQSRPHHQGSIHDRHRWGVIAIGNL